MFIDKRVTRLVMHYCLCGKVGLKIKTLIVHCSLFIVHCFSPQWFAAAKEKTSRIPRKVFMAPFANFSFYGEIKLTFSTICLGQQADCLRIPV